MFWQTKDLSLSPNVAAHCVGSHAHVSQSAGASFSSPIKWAQSSLLPGLWRDQRLVYLYSVFTAQYTPLISGGCHFYSFSPALPLPRDGTEGLPQRSAVRGEGWTAAAQSPGPRAGNCTIVF